MDTTSILFICGGAFTGLQRLISERNTQATIGFNAKKNALGGADATAKLSDAESDVMMRDVQVGDLIQYGFLPEFVGRFPVFARLQGLTEEQLIHVMCVPRNALLKQYSRLFEADSIKLHFSHDALVAIAQKALKANTGARGLRCIVENVLLEAMYELPTWRDEGVSSVLVTEAVVSDGAKVERRYKEQERDDGETAAASS